MCQSFPTQIRYLHTLNRAKLILGCALVAVGALIRDLLDDQVAVNHLVVVIVLDQPLVRGPLVLWLWVTLGGASQLQQRLSDGRLPLARLLDHDRNLPQNRRLHHLVHVAELVGGIAGICAHMILVHDVNVENLAVLLSDDGPCIVSPRDLWCWGPGCIAFQDCDRFVGFELTRRPQCEFGPIEQDETSQ